MKKFKRPKRIRVFFQDKFTKKERLVYDTPYNCLDMLRGYPRKQILKLKELYRVENFLHIHSPSEFSKRCNLATRLEFVY